MTRSSRLLIPTAAWRAVRWGLLPIAAAAMFVPFDPGMPKAGLDASWAFAMNQAVAQGLSFGDDIVFTFGPYASVYTWLYHPATVWRMVFAGVFLAASCWIALSTVVDRARWGWVVALCMAAILLRWSRDAILFLLPLLAAMAAWRVAILQDDGRQPGRFRFATRLVHVAALFAPLGLLPLIKGSALLLSVAMTVLCAAMFVAQRRPGLALTSVGSAGLAMLVFWMAAGQSPLLLPTYLSSVARLSSGYTDAMSMDGNPIEIAYFLATGLLVLAAIAASRGMTATSRLFHGCVYATFMFVIFKAGFVRHDTHALAAAISLTLAAMVLPLTIDTRWVFPVVGMACFTWGAIDYHYTKSFPFLLIRAIPKFSSSVREATGRASGHHPLRRAFDASLGRLRNDMPFPRLPGTTDIYSFDQSYLFASDNLWSPRPVFQSYAAYEPDLAAMNKAHLTGPNAPDNVIFRVEPIGGRLASLEDGPSWPVLATQYAMSRRTGDFLILKRRASPGPAGARVILSRSARIGERVPLPRLHNPVFATIAIAPTALGRVATFLFKSDQLSIVLDMADGSRKTYALIPGMAAAGFVVSPLVETTPGFELLYGNDEPPPSNSVGAITIQPQHDASLRHWSRNYVLTFTEFSRGAVDDETTSRTMFNASDEDARFRDPATAEWCAGSLDVVNGLAPASGAVSVSDALDVQGWLAASVQDGLVPETVFVVLTGPDGRHRYAEAQGLQRSDVAAHFNRPALASSGFKATTGIGGLRGRYTLGIGMRWHGRITVCPNLRAAVTIAPPLRTDGRR